ncbi:hypothetical protein [Streptomyces sp. ISL-86]|uniref:hypothetical protein n=1 Tax=Streptomyces sp. ISL-86 TaxID=2819187 RepID=UPI001BE57806|nr:hypothetical protein [Streptomyces sp. ISL-86]MBT2453748.1 hypothetical protein [Streptomyces sp. ISL-86]
MHDDEQHDRAGLSDGFTDLGALILDIAIVIEAAVEDAAEQDITAALTTEPATPLELAELTSRLITHCRTLAVGLGEIPLGQRSARAVGALRDWSDLASANPETDTRYDATGNLAYARMLALIAKGMLKAIREHRTARGIRQPTREAITGQPGLPPPGR